MKLLRTLSVGKGTTSRRSLLRALGVSAAAAPLIPSLNGWAAPAPGAGTGPKKLLLVFTPDGIVPNRWFPTGNETAFSFAGADHILKDMERHKADMIFLKGLPHRTSGSGAHEQAMGGCFTGNACIGKTGGAASVDQIIAKALGKPTDFQSIQFGVQSFYGGEGDLTSKLTNNNSYLIYTGPSQRVPAESDPYKMFNNVFGGFKGGGGMGDLGVEFEKVRAEKKSIIDFVKKEITDLTGRVATDDKVKIDSHIEGIRDIERRLDAAGRTGGMNTCATPTKPEGTPDWLAKNAYFPQLIPIMNKLLVATLACDRTRIASMQYSRGFSNTVHDWVGAKQTHHTLSHGEGNAKVLGDIQQWYFGHIAKLFDDLKAVNEGGKSMFDNMVILYANECYLGWTHAAGPKAAFLAGKGAGAFPKTGLFKDYSGTGNDWQQMLTTVCHAMGVTSVNQVGNLGKAGIVPGILS
jgi:hypothetical protein